MKNKLRMTLLSEKPNDKKAALRAIEVIERYSTADLYQLLLKSLYKDAGFPYEYIKSKNLLTVTQIDDRLAVLNTLLNSADIIQWILNYCKSKREITSINFDTLPIDQFLSFALIFNPCLYDDINAMLSFENERQSKEFIRADYGQPEIYKHIHALGDTEKAIENLNSTGIVLETYRKNRGIATNITSITHITPTKSFICNTRLKNLAERQKEWFNYTVVRKKSDSYEALMQRYPIETKAFEEILAGTRHYYVRTDEPDYTTPPLKTYEFTDTTYCHLSELGQTIYRELKDELSKKVPSAYERPSTGLLKTDFEEMRHAPNYSEALEAMHKKDVVAVAQKVSVTNIFPDCVTLLCENVHVKTESGWDNSEATIKKMVVEIDTHINMDIINRIHHQGITLYGSIEYQLGDGGSELGLHVKSFSIII